MPCLNALSDRGTWGGYFNSLLFGFCRGAYTVRVLAALLHTYGLLAPADDNLLPYVLKQFVSVRATHLAPA